LASDASTPSPSNFLYTQPIRTTPSQNDISTDYYLATQNENAIYTQNQEEEEGIEDNISDKDLSTQNQDFIESSSDSSEGEQKKSSFEDDNTVEYLSSPTILRSSDVQEDESTREFSTQISKSPDLDISPITSSMKKRKQEKEELVYFEKRWRDRPIVVNWKSWL
jgi:hypothetical protein